MLGTIQDRVEMYFPGREPGPATLKEKQLLKEFEDAIINYPGKYKNFFTYYWSREIDDRP